MRMVTCPKCGHENLPSYSTCSRCSSAIGSSTPGGGVPLAGGQPTTREPFAGAPPSPFAQKPRGKNKPAMAAVAVLAVAALAFVWLRDRRARVDVATKLEFVDKWAAIDNDDVGAFWNCAMAGKINVGLFQNANQVQQRIETAYATQPQGYADILTTECLPKLERGRQAAGDLTNVPAELQAPLDAYKAALPKLAHGLEAYVEKLGARGTGKDMDALIQDFGDKWHAQDKPTPETVAFEKFINCAVPSLGKLKNAQAMLEFLHDACFKKDAVAFMNRARDACGSLLQNPTSKTPSKTWGQSKRFFEPEARQMQAWDSCSRRARKGRKNEDLTEFLAAFADYFKARADFAKAAHALAP